MQRTLSDWGGNLAAFAAVILVNALSKTLPFNDQTMAEISAKYPSLFTPAGFTFAIWGIIYLALLVFVVWQALPAQRGNAKVAAISKYFQLNCLMNAVWMVVWHYDLVAISVIVMFVILATLVMIYRTLIDSIDTAPFVEHIVLYLPFSIYTGWISLATIANLSVLQNLNGWDDVWLTAVQWTLLKLAVAGAVGAMMLVKFKDIPFALVVAWGAYGISVMQSATPEVSGAAMSLSLLALILVAMDSIRRLVHAF